MKHRSPHSILSKTASIVLVLLLATACRAELHHDLSEAEANTIAVTLERAGVFAYKQPDPGNESQWMIAVDEGQQLKAWEILQAYGLPRNHANNRGMDKIGLLPTPQEEHAAKQQKIALKLEQWLVTIPGVIDARVHLALPTMEPLAAAGLKAAPKNKASVLLKIHPDYQAKIESSTATRMVANAVPKLLEEDIHVTQSVAVLPTSNDAPTWAALGPWRVSPGSQTPIQVLFAVLIVIILLQSGIIAYVLVRTRRAQGKTA